MSNVRPLVQRPEWLLFDLGGVLVDNVAFERLNEIPGLGLNEAEIKSRWLASPTVRALELGAISPQEFARAFVNEWRIATTPEVFLEEFAGWPKGFYAGAPALLAQLRSKFKVGCLSNSNSVHWERLGHLCEHFDVALSSHSLHAIKPDAPCFERALKECRSTAQRVAFFDDSFENVEAARRLGMQAFHVCGVAQVSHSLAQSGWLQ